LLVCFFVCQNGSKAPNIYSDLMAELEADAYEYIGEGKLPAGISDTVLLGYIQPENGIFHELKARFTSDA
jgi:hypothetical protein